MGNKTIVRFTEKIYETSTIDDMRLIFSQCESRNKSLNELGDSLYQKTLVYLGISLTALTSLAVYISDINPVFSAKYVSSILLIIFLSAICNILRKNIELKEYYGVGAYPSDLVNEDFYTDLQHGKTPEWYILERLIKDYQQRVEANHETNSERADNLRSAVNWIFWTPGVIILTYILFTLFHF